MIFYRIQWADGRAELVARACRAASGTGGAWVTPAQMYEALSESSRVSCSPTSFRGNVRHALSRGYLVQQGRGLYRPSPRWCEEFDRVRGLEGLGLV